MGTQWCRDFHTGRSIQARQRLSAEADNLQAVHHRAVAALEPTTGAANLALLAALALDPLLRERGSAGLRLSLFDEAIALSARAGAEATLRALAFEARADARRLAGHLPESRADIEKAGEFAEAMGDDARIGSVRLALGNIEWSQGRLAEAQAYYEQALAIGERIGDRLLQARAVSSLGNVAFRCGNLAEARGRYERALSAYREVGSLPYEAIARAHLAGLLFSEGSLEPARVNFRASLRIVRRLGNRWIEGQTLGNLACVDLEQGRLQRAQRGLERAIRILRELGVVWHEGLLLCQLGNCHLQKGDRESARECLERALEIQEGTGNRLYAGLTLGLIGWLEATEGRFEASRLAFERSGGLIESGDAHPFRRAVDMYRGHLDLALARVAQKADDLERARGLRESALVRVRSGGGEPSSDVRLARRTLQDALRRMAPGTARPIDGPSAADRDTAAITIGAAGRWFRSTGGPRVELDRRTALRRILRRLARQRLQAPGEPLSTWDLLESGWPGEQIRPRSGVERVHVAISMLRKLGLEPLLLHRAGGYLLDPSIALREVPDDEDGG